VLLLHTRDNLTTKESAPELRASGVTRKLIFMTYRPISIPELACGLFLDGDASQSLQGAVPDSQIMFSSSITLATTEFTRTTRGSIADFRFFPLPAPGFGILLILHSNCFGSLKLAC